MQGTTVVLISLVAWRVAALTVWLIIAVSAVEIVMHIFHPHHHRAHVKDSGRLPRALK